MALAPVGSVSLPPFRDSGFDHGDFHLASRRIFVAHTAQGTIEVIDAERLFHAGRVQVIDAGSLTVVTELTTGPKPNGLSWNGRSGILLVRPGHHGGGCEH